MSSPLRVLIGADTYPPDVNGAARFTERLAGGLAGRGHEVHVVAPSPTGPPGRGGGAPGHPVVHRVRSHAYPSQERFRVSLPWRAAAATAELLGELRPDVVHVQSHFSVGRGLAVAAHARGVPLVATNHFMPENLLDHAPVPASAAGWVSRWAWRDLARVYGRADALTAPTPCAVRMLDERAGLPGGRAVSCGIDVARFAGGAEDPVPTVLFVGRLEQEKRVGELVAAFARVPGDVRLEIVGDGSRRAEWTALARRLGVESRVRFRGFVDDDELVAAYRRAAVFAIPGVAELQSLVTLEAMAAGRPVVAADAVALPHLVRPGRTGWLYPPGDVDALAAALSALLADPAARARMGAAARETAGTHALDATLDAFTDLYARVCGTRVTRRARERTAAA
ncbi:glycosyltransferase involved in cell wall biosynthesis [Pseudonocardia sediminis]|uniref:Glycosyltransferase involved in cell wall biosynthesis n=1 Tax=Pseudonocardia sediminis TaxID=1397368 RepID=A0A4Q7UW52_PSEST|nr:glycosyltransferase [Pseudonocardia sediminis]RZT85198.1 glycosyltransferase involved in cell wall biosynthesis [Pseudonocardia sediminis]